MTQEIQSREIKSALDSSLCLIVVGAALTLYLGVLAADFVNYDDNWQVVENPAIRHLSFESLGSILSRADHGEFLPLKTLSYGLDRAFYGEKARGFHFTNLVLWGAGAALLWIFFRRFLPRWAAFFGALLFVVHPIHVEAVAWISARKHILGFFFFLLSVNVFALYRDSTPLTAGGAWGRMGRAFWRGSAWLTTSRLLFYFISLFVFFLAVLSSATTLSLPLAILTVDIAFFRPKRSWKIILIDKLPFLAVAGAATMWGLSLAYGMGYVVQGIERTTSGLALTMARVFARYLGLLIWPARLSAQYLVPLEDSFWNWRVALSLSLVAGFLAILALSRRRAQAIFFGLVWFVVNMIPVSNVIPIHTPSLMADRYMLIPSVGFSFLLGASIYYVFANRKGFLGSSGLKVLAGIGLCVLLGFYSLKTLQRVGDWRDSKSLWASEVKNNALNYNAYLNLGQVIVEEAEASSDPKEKEGLYLKAEKLFLTAVGLKEDYILGFYNLGYIELSQGKISTALDMLRRVVEYPTPAYMPEEVARKVRSKAHFLRGRIRLDENRFEEALLELDKAVEEDSTLAAAHYWRGLALASLGRTEEALQQLQEAERLATSDSDLGHQAAVARRRIPLLEPFRAQLPREALKFLGADWQIDEAKRAMAEQENLRASQLILDGKFVEAISSLMRALYYNPELTSAHVNLAVAMHGMGEDSPAIRHLERINQRSPGQVNVVHLLGKLYSYQRELTKAESLFREAIRLDPARRDAYLDLAEIYGAKGELAKGLQVMEEAERLFPEDPEIARKKAELLTGDKWKKLRGKAEESRSKEGTSGNPDSDLQKGN